MNTELIERIATYITKLSIAKDKARPIIKGLTGIDIEDLENRLNR